MYTPTKVRVLHSLQTRLHFVDTVQVRLVVPWNKANKDLREFSHCSQHTDLQHVMGWIHTHIHTCEDTQILASSAPPHFSPSLSTPLPVVCSIPHQKKKNSCRTENTGNRSTPLPIASAVAYEAHVIVPFARDSRLAQLESPLHLK